MTRPTTIAGMLEARAAAELRYARHPGHADRHYYAESLLRSLAAEIRAMPETSGVESACAWLDAREREPLWVAQVETREASTSGLWTKLRHSDTWRATTIAAARALGWTPPTPPAEPLVQPTTCGACDYADTLVGVTQCTHGKRLVVFRDLPPPDWCPLPKEPRT